MNERTSAAALELLLRAGGAKLLSGMIAAFRDSAPERMARAYRALARNDAAALASAAHSLKSSAGQLGAAGLERSFTEIEELAIQQRLGEIEPILAAAEAELQFALAWMREYSTTRAE